MFQDFYRFVKDCQRLAFVHFFNAGSKFGIQNFKRPELVYSIKLCKWYKQKALITEARCMECRQLTMNERFNVICQNKWYSKTQTYIIASFLVERVLTCILLTLQVFSHIDFETMLYLQRYKIIICTTTPFTSSDCVENSSLKTSKTRTLNEIILGLFSDC